MSDGTRTRGRRDHNPELYQLSYAHQAQGSLAASRESRWTRTDPSGGFTDALRGEAAEDEVLLVTAADLFA